MLTVIAFRALILWAVLCLFIGVSAWFYTRTIPCSPEADRIMLRGTALGLLWPPAVFKATKAALATNQKLRTHQHQLNNGGF